MNSIEVTGSGRAALGFVRERGVVLATAKGPVPRLIDAIAGETIKGNWWTHPQARAIYAVLVEVQEAEEVLPCRLINGKVTLVHARLWPALVRLDSRFSLAQLAKISEEHLPSGRHALRELPYPQWLPPGVAEAAAAMSEEEALAALLATGLRHADMAC